MIKMEKRDEDEDNNQKFNDDNPDPTKVAFFSDMGNMEEEIAAEAIELVTHALSLIGARFYDDSIEILRQAIGLYEQINKIAEVDALNKKISEIYLLKEQSFREIELETDTIIEDSQEEVLLDENGEELYIHADSLIVEALQLVTNERFDEALDKYDEATEILKKLSKELELKKLSELIEDCFNKKAEFVQIRKKASTGEVITLEQDIEGSLSKLEKKAQKVRAFEEFKRKENQISNQAYELIGKATELKKIRQYDEALKLYDTGLGLFQEINWNNEVKKIKNMMEQVETEKKRFLEEVQKIKAEEERAEEIKKQKEATLIDNAQVQEQIKNQAQTEKLRAQSERKQEQTTFQNEIAEMVDYAEKLARDYDLRVKKAIKRGKLDEECAFPVVIKIYEELSKKVKDRGWKDQVELYANQIRHYRALLEKDKNLRQIEFQKRQKQKEYDEALKIKTDPTIVEVDVAQNKDFEEQRKREAEAKNFREIIENLVNRAEKIAREYNTAFKKAVKEGNLNIESKYPKIIKIYTKARDDVLKKGWNEDAAILSSHIRKYSELLEKEERIREIEAKKDEEKKAYEEFQKIQIKEIDADKIKEIDVKKVKKFEGDKFQKEITNLVDKAERMARDYEVALKKAIRAGKLIENSPYSRIIEIYHQIREGVVSRGWNDQILMYTNQIRIYQDKLESDNKLREIELQKIQKRKEFEESLKIKTESIPIEKLKEIESKKSKKLDEQNFQKEITGSVDKAEKLAREYERTKKSALKEGKELGEAPYFEIIEIYTKLRNKVLTREWTDQALIYAKQIKIYQEKLESDKKLRQIELEKIQKRKEFEESLKVKAEGLTVDKLRNLESLSTQEQDEEKFEREIDDLVDNAEKLAREYDLAIKRGQFEKECPYLVIAELYKKIRKKVYALGWKDEADIYGNQINRYREKYERDKRLRELEAKKIEKQQHFEESLKITKEVKKLKLQEIQAIESKDREADGLLNEAMNLINEAENEVRSYELSLKKDLLYNKSPYKKAILNYEKARKLFQKIGWKEEAHRLITTITFYKEKEIKDENLRLLEQQKLETSKEKLKYKPKEEVFAHENKIIEFEKIKEATTKESEEIFNIINRAERLAQEYEIKKKKGIMNIESPYEEIINMYMTAKKEFEKIGWNEQANQIINSIHHYQEKSKVDKRRRSLETKRISKEEENKKRRKIETSLAREAEAELLKQKGQALELKRKQALEYESKRDQAFNFMDLAKKEFKQKNFDKAVKFYKESEKIFVEINWSEGQKMIKESIKVIKLKKERIEEEQKVAEKQKAEKLKLEAQIEDEIIKAKDLQTLQQDQRRQEFLTIQKEKEREKEISENAYHFLEEGTKLKNKKKFEEAFEKYIMGRNLFKQIDWQHEVSRINNDLLFILKKEMKQTEKIKAMQQKKVEERKELEVLLNEAENKRKELDQINKEEKRKRREEIVQKELDAANDIIKDLKYNEGIFKLKKVIKKLEKLKQDKLIKQMNKQIEVLENASQVPIITTSELERGENINKFELAYHALDNAQISLSNNLFMKAITELNEAIFNLKQTKIGIKYISLIESKVNSYKKELDIKPVQEQEVEIPKVETDDIRAKIAARRAERRKKIKELMSK
jgi:hypothetical protein